LFSYAADLSHFASSKVPLQAKFGTLERLERDKSAAKLNATGTTGPIYLPRCQDQQCFDGLYGSHLGPLHVPSCTTIVLLKFGVGGIKKDKSQ
jgi:hypothetical protein